MLVASRRDEAPVTEGSPPSRHAYWVAPGIAAFMLFLTLVWGAQYGLGLRDPDGIIGWRFSFVVALVGGFWALDVIPRGIMTARTQKAPTWATLVAIARERWPWGRFAFVIGSIAAFYVTYLCYRNIKSYLPLARPRILDGELADFERSLFGQDPAALLHQLLGTGVSAQVLSTVYLLFLTFVPISVGVTLVWFNNRAGALWWVSVLSINWVIGALSYFVLPSMGPAFTEPWLFNALPDTGTAMLQHSLLEERRTFVGDPVGSGELQSIAAFASLHISIVFAGALMAHLLRAPRAIRIGMWIYLGLTFPATIYFGWHYVVDDLAGFVMGFFSVYLGAVLTGWRIERSRATARLQLKSA
jgi:hypothetical protein